MIRTIRRLALAPGDRRGARRGRPTVPSTLSEELATNPFLRAAGPESSAHLGLDGRPTPTVFAEIRSPQGRVLTRAHTTAKI